MVKKTIKEKKLLYHLTRLSNLDSILDLGLVSRQSVQNAKQSFDDIADQQIISKRVQLGLEHYTPFHFHPNSSFDVAVKKTHSSEEFVYICITRELAKLNRFKVLLNHPLHLEKDYKMYDYAEGFEAIDWEAMHLTGTEDTYVKNVKMAECLTEKIIPAKNFQCIYVKDEITKKLVEEKLERKSLLSKPPFVDIGPWF